MKSQTISILFLLIFSLFLFSCAHTQHVACQFSTQSLSQRFNPQEYKSIKVKNHKKIYGVRIDPSYLTLTHTNNTCDSTAEDIVTNLKKIGVNTIFLYAYSPVYGAYYPTNYNYTKVEPTFGYANIFRNIAFEAKKNGMTVVASIPLNNFKSVWMKMPEWRVKLQDQNDYTPQSEIRLLSASSSAFQEWLKGFIDDLVEQNPEIDIVEAVEPTLDYEWEQKSDFNPAAQERFTNLYPNSPFDKTAWAQFRSDEFTNLIKIFNKQVHKNNRKSGLVHTWPAKNNGNLYSALEVSQNTAFNFKAIALLTEDYKTDHLAVELSWQQWHSQFGNNIFNPNWIELAKNDIQQQLLSEPMQSNLILHFELSRFSGDFGSTEPTVLQFNETLELVKKMKYGISIYDYNQMFNRNYFIKPIK
ncbi:MAG: hypothetical protein ABL930_08615 [Pseudobdellovibrio sp.]